MTWDHNIRLLRKSKIPNFVKILRCFENYVLSFKMNNKFFYDKKYLKIMNFMMVRAQKLCARALRA